VKNLSAETNELRQNFFYPGGGFRESENNTLRQK